MLSAQCSAAVYQRKTVASGQTRKRSKALQNGPAYNPNLDLDGQPFEWSYPPRIALEPNLECPFVNRYAAST